MWVFAWSSYSWQWLLITDHLNMDTYTQTFQTMLRSLDNDISEMTHQKWYVLLHNKAQGENIRQ